MIRKAAAYASMDRYTSAAEASPYHLINMLFDGAIERIQLAKGAMSRNEIANKGTHISKAITIVDGLRAHLDMDKGGDIATNLRDLYNFVELTLFEANINNQSQQLDSALQVLTTLQSGWAEIAPKPASQDSTTDSSTDSVSFDA